MSLAPRIDGEPLHSIFTTQDQSRHRALRAGVAQKYSLSSLLRLEPLVDEVTQNLFRRMRTQLANSPTVNLGEWLQFYAFDVVGAITFSKTFEFLDSGCDFNGVIEGLELGLKYASVVGQVPFWHWWLLGNPLPLKFVESFPALRSKDPVMIVHGMIKDALLAEGEKKDINAGEDFLQFLRKQNEKDGEKMTKRDMVNHMFVNL